MNNMMRRRQYHQKQRQQAASVPAWAELQKMTEDQVRALAGTLGIPFTGRMETLSALNKARG